MGGIYGRPPDTVLDDVDKSISEFRGRIKDLDTMWRMFKDVKTIFAIDRIAKLAAWAHGERVWIHPFANMTMFGFFSFLVLGVLFLILLVLRLLTR